MKEFQETRMERRHLHPLQSCIPMVEGSHCHILDGLLAGVCFRFLELVEILHLQPDLYPLQHLQVKE